jgi:hypothetical protein
MLHEGTISVDEASELLEAVVNTEASQAAAERRTAFPGVDTEAPTVAPDLGRLRHLSLIPLAVSLLLTILSGWGAYALILRTEGVITFGFVVLAILFALTLVATALSLWAATVPWLHVRIRSAPGEDSSGKRFAISLPVPLTLAGWGIRIAHRFVDRETAGHLDASAELVATMRYNLGKPGAVPIVVDIDDEDEQVQVYIG